VSSGPRTLVIVLGLLLLLSPDVWPESSYRVLHSFGAEGDGAVPAGTLALGSDGALYGTTGGGDTGCKGGYSRGTIFELTKGLSGEWDEDILYCFAGQYIDGFPDSGLSIDAQGNLYGTSAGGPNDLATVYQLMPAEGGWTLSLLYDLGAGPGVTLDKTGDIFGEMGIGKHKGGAMAELSPSLEGWVYTQLYSFCSEYDCKDGYEPLFPPIWDGAGDLFGTTYYGGVVGCSCGVAYEMTPKPTGKWEYHVLHRFGSFPKDGLGPAAGLAIDSSGALYGNTVYGGPHKNGTIFKLAYIGGRWKETLLYGFPNCSIGCLPNGTMVFDQAGNLYGVNSGGMVCDGIGCGVVFKMTPQVNGTWRYSVVHKFNGEDGAGPVGVIIDEQGNLFGTTSRGGTYNAGVAFEITP